MRHRVPLSRQAQALLAEARKATRGALVFPAAVGRDAGQLRDDPRAAHCRNRGVSSHGFRSSIKDWAGQLDVDELLSEFALAHVESLEKSWPPTRGTTSWRNGGLSCSGGPTVSRSSGSLSPCALASYVAANEWSGL